MTSREDKHVIPDMMYDAGNGTMYKKGKFFGKGGFAKCYELTELKTNNIYAGKIVSKKIIASNNQKDKMMQEITIHRSLNHKHIVGFYSFFEDNHNVYIVLELCRCRSLMELHKRRKTLTEPEVRYFLRQILHGVDYLHKRNIIHRDLKLGNLFLDDDLEVKIGDFGLAAKVEYQGERKKTLCGTPNYIAPEILTKKGHSFEVDVWSIGCLVYTLLFGKPPFETNSLKETYSLIKKCEYCLPVTSQVSAIAKKLIRDMLQSDPKQRPKVEDLLNSEFLAGYIPKQLPMSCLTTAPRFNSAEKSLARKPLLEVNVIDESPANTANGAVKKPVQPLASPKLDECLQNLKTLSMQLVSVLHSNPSARACATYGDEATDPAAQPIVWICKWVDYSDKYGFGYQLSDESVGVMFNDNSKLVMLADGLNVHYITRDGEESYHTMTEFPSVLDKKMKLLSYFRRYMNEHLLKAGGCMPPRESDSLSRIPCMFQWCRTASAVIMHLNNGTVQVNFSDHTKIIMCPHMAAVTYIDEQKNFRTFRFSSIRDNGCSAALEKCLKYAYDRLSSMEARAKSFK